MSTIERIVPRPARLIEVEVLEAIGRVTQDIIVGTGNPDLLGLCGDRDQVEAAVKILKGPAGMTKATPDFLIDCAAAIAAAPFDEVLDVAERCGLRIKDHGYTGYSTTGYGIRAQTTAGPQQSVQAWARKVEAAFGRTAGDAA